MPTAVNYALYQLQIFHVREQHSALVDAIVFIYTVYRDIKLYSCKNANKVKNEPQMNTDKHRINYLCSSVFFCKAPPLEFAAEPYGEHFHSMTGNEV